ncbi:MAG: hypothetical protein RDU89_06970 [bacterium]|nr:hypothetical protein [bacterium]
MKDRFRDYQSHKPKGMAVSEWKALMDKRKAEFETRIPVISDEEFSKLVRASDEDDGVLR